MQNIVIIILSAGLLLVIFALLRRKEAKQDETGLHLLLEQMNNLSRTVDQKLGESCLIIIGFVTGVFGLEIASEQNSTNQEQQSQYIETDDIPF